MHLLSPRKRIKRALERIPNNPGILGAHSERSKTPRDSVPPQHERQRGVAGIEEHSLSPPLCTSPLPRMGPKIIGTSHRYVGDWICMRAASLRLPERAQ